MSSQGKLSIRPLPHLDFVLGWPGIAANKETSRNSAHIAGNVEIRLGNKGLKASWLRIELRKIETVPGGENWGELIGSGPIDVWSARSGGGKGDREQDSDGQCWEILKSEDFPFRINIPEALPPSAKLDKLCGVQYEVVTSLCVKTKKGLLRKEDVSSVMQSVQPIILDKHEMHSTWPKYNQPDTHSGERGMIRAKLRRERYCFAPGDKIRVKVIVQSNRVEPAKLKSVAVTIKETVTFHGVKPSKKSITSNSDSARPSMQRVEVVTQKAKQIGKKIYKGDSKDYDLELIIPKNHALMSIATAKHIEVSYTMRLYVDISKAPIVIDHVPMIMTTFPRQSSLAMMKKIGFVEGLSERELLIDDDFDDASTTQGVSRSARPMPTRSLSFAGSSSTGGGIGYNDTFLQRRDTSTTNATGGMAGRGVPGQFFDYSPYGGGGGPQPMPGPSPFAAMMTNEGPTSAFMNPQIDNDSPLSAQERSALYHHSDNPRNGMNMGGADYGTNSYFGPDRSPSQRASFIGIPARPATANAALAVSVSEEEKERLYRRAREQAERNQRRADEARAALAAGGTLPNSTISQDDELANLTASESEKLRLWERARREAENYQRSFSEGASFPNVESAGSSRMQTPALARVDEDAPLNETQTPQSLTYLNPHTQGQRPLSTISTTNNRNSAMFWLENPEMAAAGSPAPAKREVSNPSYPSYPSAEEEKKRLYERAKAETDASVTASSSTNITPASSAAFLGEAPSYSASTIVSTGPTTGLSEKEQMKRFYAAQEEVQKFQSKLDEAEGSGGVGIGSTNVATPQPMNNHQNGKPLLSEKEQIANYHAAQAEVQRNLANAYDSQGASSSSSAPIMTVQQPQPSTALTEKEQLARYHAAQEEVEKYTLQQSAIPSSSSSNVPNGNQPPKSAVLDPNGTTLSEKEQMRQYWEARDREAQKNSQAAAVAAASPNAIQQNMASPRPMYAPNFHGLPFTSPGNVQSSPASTPLPQVPFKSVSNGGSNLSNNSQGTKPRVVSYTPQTQYSQQQQQLPSFSHLTLNHRGGTPNPLDGPWAPKIASSVWDDDHLENNKKDDAPPPLPPKTMLSGT